MKRRSFFGGLLGVPAAVADADKKRKRRTLIVGYRDQPFFPGGALGPGRSQSCISFALPLSEADERWLATIRSEGRVLYEREIEA